MPYSPGNRFKGADFMASAMDAERQRREKEKQDVDLMKGFKALHQASPELQQIIPIEDFGDMSANAVRGIMEGLTATVQQQQLQMQAQQQQFQQQAQMQEMQAQQAMQGFRERSFDEQMALRQQQAQRRPEMISIAGEPTFMLSPSGNLQRIPPQPQDLPQLGASLPDGSVFRGKVNAQGQPIYDPPPRMSVLDQMMLGQMGGQFGQMPPAGGAPQLPAMPATAQQQPRRQQSASTGTVIMQAPDGTRMRVPAGSVDKYRARGATVVQ